MISKVVDIADQLSNGHYAYVDLGGWQTVSIQAVGIGGTMSLSGSNDGGAITGSTIDNARDSANYNAVQATNLTTGAAATAVTGTTLFQISVIGFRWLRIGDGSTATATKLLVFLTKPY